MVLDVLSTLQCKCFVRHPFHLRPRQLNESCVNEGKLFVYVGIRMVDPEMVKAKLSKLGFVVAMDVCCSLISVDDAAHHRMFLNQRVKRSFLSVGYVVHR